MDDYLEAAAHVAYYYRPDAPGARPPGSFARKLIEAFAHADMHNHLRLSLAYPAYSKAVTQARYGFNGGMEALLDAIAPKEAPAH